MTTKKIALVTGGSRGLGKDMAMALSGKGIDVVRGCQMGQRTKD